MGCKKFAAKCDSHIAKRIRTIAKDSSCVFLTKHLKVRMAQCKVTAIEVLDCIRNGIISRAPEQSRDGQSPGMPNGAVCCRQKFECGGGAVR